MVDSASDYIRFFEENEAKIPNINRLIKILDSYVKSGRDMNPHLIHAEAVKRFYESKEFNVTDVEKRGKNLDVDIELDGNISIQVWHGASTGSHNIERKPLTKTREFRGKKVRWDSGGVKVDWDKDRDKIMDKLGQLPGTGPGFVLCFNRFIGISVLPEWKDQIKENKAILELFLIDYGSGVQGEGHIHRSTRFRHTELAKKIGLALGYPIKDINDYLR